MKQDKTLDRFKTMFAEDKEAKTEAIDISRDLLYLVNNALEGGKSPKLSKAVAIGSMLYTLGVAGHKVWKMYKKSNAAQTYTIKITEDDAIFEIVEDWFMEALPEEEQLSIYAHSTITKGEPKSKRKHVSDSQRIEDMNDANMSSEKDQVNIGFSFDGTIVQSLTIAGHDVEVYTNIPEGTKEGAQKNQWNSRSMNIVCKTVEAKNAVLKEIEDQSQHLVRSQPRMYVTSRWGDWRKRSEIQPRSRDSVVLKDGQMDRILDHLNMFLTNKEAYKKADIPFRTGILLHGDPGSGKSSTALAIANELKMNVYLIALSSLLNDEALNDCFSSIPPNSIIILEDIDVAHAMKDRDADDDKGVTMSGMLNVLDGFQSPPGVITIMTTNRLEVLDKAIIRPGRVDLTEHLDCLDNSQLRGICEYFIGQVPEDLPEVNPNDGISSADIMGVIRQHLPDFENAADDMVDFIRERVLTKVTV